MNWATQRNLKQLKGFLGITGYCRRFIKNWGKVCRPLTELLKKDAYHWNEEAAQAFVTLKKLITEAPVLTLLDFFQEFLIEADASGYGMEQY